MTSSRLPGKVLLPVLGRPLLAAHGRAPAPLARIDAIVARDDRPSRPRTRSRRSPRELGIGCFRGSEDDVLGRVLGAARAARRRRDRGDHGGLPADRPGGRRPRHRGTSSEGGADYCSNTLERTYPDGLDVQVFPTAVLAEVDRLTDDPADREHVSLYIYEHPERYRLRNVASPRPDDGRLARHGRRAGRLRARHGDLRGAVPGRSRRSGSRPSSRCSTRGPSCARSTTTSRRSPRADAAGGRDRVRCDRRAAASVAASRCRRGDARRRLRGLPARPSSSPPATATRERRGARRRAGVHRTSPSCWPRRRPRSSASRRPTPPTRRSSRRVCARTACAPCSPRSRWRPARRRRRSWSALARERGVVLGCHYTRRFAPAYRRLAEEVGAGALGRLQHVGGVYVKGLRHNGTHWLDLLRMLAGDPVAVRGWDRLARAGRRPVAGRGADAAGRGRRPSGRARHARVHRLRAGSGGHARAGADRSRTATSSSAGRSATIRASLATGRWSRAGARPPRCATAPCTPSPISSAACGPGRARHAQAPTAWRRSSWRRRSPRSAASGGAPRADRA